MKIVKVKLSPEAEKAYRFLSQRAPNSKTERMIFKAINQKVEFIKSNPHFGSPISKKLFPEEYKKKYQINNLFHVELPAFWRMIYTLIDGGDGAEIISFILDIFDHKDYNEKFGYRRR